MKQIKAQIEETTSDYDREKLQERLAKLAGGVAIIKVGAGTEIELKEKKHRVEDALSATRSALEEGIVPGGGVALLNAQKALDGIKLEGDAADRREHRAPGARGAAAASSPRTPASTATSCIENVRRDQAEQKIDHARLQRDDRRVRGHARRRASSTRPRSRGRPSRTPRRSRAMVLTTEAMITDKPEPKSAMPQMPPGGGMDF